MNLLNEHRYVMSKDGLKPENVKVLPAPQGKATLFRLKALMPLQFVPNLAEVSAPLRKLLGVDVSLALGTTIKIPDHQSTVTELLTKLVLLSVDANSEDLGTVPLEVQPVTYGSR